MPVSQTTDQTLLYVYRPHNFSNVLITPRLRIDAQHEFDIADGECVWLSLAPGHYSLRLQLAERYQGQHRLDLALRAGERRFVSLTTQLKFQKNQLYDRRFDLNPVDESQALQQISDCGPYGEAKGGAKNDAGTEADKAQESEFSIQKSRDPFSRQR